MGKKPKSLGQVDYEAGKTSFNYTWDELWTTARERCEKGAQAVKRAVLREVKPQLDAGKRDAVLAEHYRGVLEQIGSGKTSAARLARSAVVFGDQLLRE